MICLLPVTFLPGPFFFFCVRNDPTLFVLSQRGAEVYSSAWVPLWTCVEALNVFRNLDIRSRGAFSLCWGPVFSWRARDGEGMISEAFFSPGCSVQGLPSLRRLAAGLSEVTCQNFCREYFTQNKNYGWSSLPFPFLSLFSTFCLRTTSKSQMCWCQTPGSYC